MYAMHVEEDHEQTEELRKLTLQKVVTESLEGCDGAEPGPRQRTPHLG